MGACLGKDSVTSTIDQEIRHEAQSPKNIKILLLGPGDSGKSTFLKQMKLTYFHDFSGIERHRATIYLRENVVSGMKAMLHHLKRDNCPPTLLTQYDSIINISADETSPEKFQQIKDLWQIKELKRIYEKRTELCLDIASNLHIFFDSIDRIMDPAFVPTNEDILQTRTKTTGVQETRFELRFGESLRQIHIIDVGGQRSERRKWLHHFSDVDIVIYFSSLEAYCQKMYEDEVTNRLTDDLELFSQLMKMDDVLQKKQWFLFLNKSDLFRQRLLVNPFNKHFPDISSENGKNYDFCIQYIKNKFIERWSGGNLEFFITNALDQEKIREAFLAIQARVSVFAEL